MSTESQTTRSGMKNFGSRKNKKAAQSKKDNDVKNMEDNVNRSNQAKRQPRNTAKIAETIDVGAEFISTYFQGFEEEERANIKADVDDNLPFRLAECYNDRISDYVLNNHYTNDDQAEAELMTDIRSGMSLAMAAKLYQSSTEPSKDKNYSFTALRTATIVLPQQAALIIDSLGKTDLPNDNHFRIKNQDYAAKRHAVRGLMLTQKTETLNLYVREDRNLGEKPLETLLERLKKDEWFTNMIDDTAISLERIKQIGKDAYQKMSDVNLSFQIDSEEYSFRLPKFNITDDFDLNNLGTVLSNNFFTKFKDQENVATAIAGLTLMVAQPKWIKNSHKNMEELNTFFKNTYFQGKTFRWIMEVCNVWNINDYFHQDDLNDLVINAINKWNQSSSKVFRNFLRMTELPFSQYGNSAQLVQIDRNRLTDKTASLFNFITARMKGKVKANTPLKISEHAALLGSFSGLTKNIEFSSDFNIKHKNDNRELLQVFLKKDFI